MNILSYTYYNGKKRLCTVMGKKFLMIEVDAYFREKYSYQVFDSAEFQQVCKFNIMENNFIQKKLSEGFSVTIRSYLVDGVLVGIDLIREEFHVESEKRKNLFQFMMTFLCLEVWIVKISKISFLLHSM